MIMAHMPHRLDEKSQHYVEEGWSTLVSRLPQATRTELLDVMLATGCWHHGIDQLEMTAEKQAGDVRIWMRAVYDRRTPADNHFRLRFIAPGGEVLREEVYAADHMHAVADFLWRTKYEEDREASPAEIEARKERNAERERRIERVRQLFHSPTAEAERKREERRQQGLSEASG